MEARSAAPRPAPKTTPPPAQRISPLVGKWDTNQPGNVVEITERQGKFFGTLTKSADSKAPSGTVILRDLVKQGSAWRGKFYSPKHDRTLDAELTLSGDSLRIKIMAGPSGKTVAWKRLRP